MERIDDDKKDLSDILVIIQKLPPEPTNYSTYKNITSLDLCDPKKYYLLTIDEIDNKRYREVYGNINFLNVSKNSISTLKLKAYNLLETIIATDNCISKVELNLSRLKKIDLSANIITKIFELNSIPLLEELILNKNSISRISFEDFRPVKNTLTTLELGQNKLDFPNVKEFFDFFEQFGKNMKKIRSLVLAGNVFSNSKVYRDYAYYIISQCSLLKTFNGKLIESYDQQELNNISQVKARMLDNERQAGPTTMNMILDKNIDKKYKKQASLSLINKEMERYSQMGKLNQFTFQELRELIDAYLFSMRSDIQTDESNKLEDSELDEFETFLELSNLLIDATPSIERGLYDVIANFVIIKNGKFAYRALAYLKQRISPERVRDIESVLANTVVEFIYKTDEDSIPPAIIRGMGHFLSEPKLVLSLKKLVSKLITVIESFKNIKIINAKSSEENKRKEIYHCSITSLSNASNTFEFLSLMILSENFIDSVSYQIKTLLYEGDEAISTDTKALEILQQLLNIIRSMCLIKYIDENTTINRNVEKLVGSGLRDKIEQALNIKLQEISRKKGNEEVKNDTLREVNYNKKLIFANLMRCLGSLLYRSKDIIKLVETKNSIPMKIINILIQTEMNDPIIIAAACDFVLSFLQNRMMKQNVDGIFDKTSDSLYNLNYILPYLFQDKTEFKNACIIADKYGQNTVSKARLLICHL